MSDLSDEEYEMVIFAIRAARVYQIPSADRLRSTLRCAFPAATAESVQRAIRHIANRIVATERR